MQANDLRIALHGWTDAFTPIDGLSQKARKHKYGAFLATLVNLPLHLRHYVDHVLLLALYNSRYAKKHGGLVRMLTGPRVCRPHPCAAHASAARAHAFPPALCL